VSAPGPDLAAIADAVARLPSVSRLYGGRLAEIATHGPGERILGVRLRDDVDETGQGQLDVHIVVAAGFSPLDAANAVHAEVSPLSSGRAVNVFVDDLDLEGPLPSRPALPPGSAAALPATDDT
jgi:hypothetical protein